MATDVTYIGGFSNVNASNYPKGDETRREGDDNIRITRGAIKRTFPNFFGAAVTPNENQLNTLDGIQTGGRTIEQRLNDYEKSFPINTVILFRQAAVPPDGWTLLSNEGANGRFLRIVDGAGGGFGGLHNPIVMDHVPRHTHGANSEVAGGHDHNYTWITSGTGTAGGIMIAASGGTIGNNSQYLDAVADHLHTVNVFANIDSPLGKDENWQPFYRDVVAGVKVQV